MRKLIVRYVVDCLFWTPMISFFLIFCGWIGTLFIESELLRESFSKLLWNLKEGVLIVTPQSFETLFINPVAKLQIGEITQSLQIEVNAVRDLDDLSMLK